MVSHGVKALWRAFWRTSQGVDVSGEVKLRCNEAKAKANDRRQQGSAS